MLRPLPSARRASSRSRFELTLRARWLSERPPDRALGREGTAGFGTGRVRGREGTTPSPRVVVGRAGRVTELPALALGRDVPRGVVGRGVTVRPVTVRVDPRVAPGRAVGWPGRAVGRLGRAVGWLGLAVGRLGLAVGRLGLAVGRLGRAVGRLGRAVGRLGRAVGRLGLAVGRLGRAEGRLGRALGRLGREVGRLGREVWVRLRWALASAEGAEASAAVPA
ncbi:MAG: hypothetical protein AAFR54_02905 [Planctomycetota bacterium]